MKFRIRTLSGMPKVNFYLALVFLFWSILPHYHLLVHAHASGQGNHAHLTFSAAEVALANRAMDAVGPVGVSSSGGAEFSLAEDGASVSKSAFEYVPVGTSALKKSPGDQPRHGHYWEDANLAGILSLVLTGLLAVLAISYFIRRHSAPISELSGLTLARGPPALAPA